MTERTKAYTVKELAEHWQCSQESIYALIRRKENPLPAFSIGGKLLRIKPEVVEQWQENGGSMRSAGIGSDASATSTDSTRPSSSGETTAARSTENDLVASTVRQRVESRLMRGSAASRP